MVFGIGTDLVRVDRMEKSLASPAFCRRVFGEEEQAFLAGLAARKRQESAAANFAAKEAFLKAAGRGIGGFALSDIQALRQESGAPRLAFGGTAAAWMEENGLSAHLTLSHDAGLALAFVVLEKN